MIWTIILTILALLIGIPVAIVILFCLLPIRVGAAGFYREADYDVSGWARGWAGLCGVVFHYGEGGLLLRVILGPWTVWQPRGEDEKVDADVVRPKIKREPSPEPEHIVEPVPERPPGVTESELPQDAFEPEPEVDSDPETEPQPDLDEPPEPIARAPVDTGRQVEKRELPESVEGKIEPEADETPPEPGDEKPSWWARLQTLRAQVWRYLDYVGDARPFLWRFLKRLFRIIGFRRVNLDVELGVGDPALMGRLFGYVEAVRPMLNKRVRISLTPDFVHQRFAAEGAFEISIYLYRLIWAVLALIVRGGVLAAKVWWTERKVKREASLAEA